MEYNWTALIAPSLSIQHEEGNFNWWTNMAVSLFFRRAPGEIRLCVVCKIGTRRPWSAWEIISEPVMDKRLLYTFWCWCNQKKPELRLQPDPLMNSLCLSSQPVSLWTHTLPLVSKYSLWHHAWLISATTTVRAPALTISYCLLFCHLKTQWQEFEMSGFYALLSNTLEFKIQRTEKGQTTYMLNEIKFARIFDEKVTKYSSCYETVFNWQIQYIRSSSSSTVRNIDCKQLYNTAS